MTNKQINQKLDNIMDVLTRMDARITALEESNTVSTPKSTSKKTTSSKKQSAPTKSTKTSTKSAPTKAQLDARKAWGEAQHKRAEARKELFNIVETPEYQKEWKKWQNTKAYKEASRADRKALNKAKHAEIVAKLSK